MYIYIYLEPVCPLFWWLNPSKEGLFQTKQGSIWVPGIIHIYIYIYKELPWLRWLIHLEPPDVRLCRAIPPPNPVALPAPDLDFIPFKSGVTFKVTTVHPRKLTWNPKMMIWKMSFPFPVGDFQVPC